MMDLDPAPASQCGAGFDKAASLPNTSAMLDQQSSDRP